MTDTAPQALAGKLSEARRIYLARPLTDPESIHLALARFKFMGRHLRKRIRKHQRRVGPLIKRLDTASDALRSYLMSNSEGKE